MEHKCNTCFYQKMPNGSVSPCKVCDGYNKYVSDSVYFWEEKKEMMEQKAAHEKKEYKSFLAELNREQGVPKRKFKLDDEQYDFVTKPKHYMLFPEQGIEVRDVITTLVKKIEESEEVVFSGIDYADYVQLMQYLMRFMDKNGSEDLKKAKWYLDKIIENWEYDDSDDS